jgi:hypothetical protein
MKPPLPDLFDKDKLHAPAAQALRSRKRETYCLEVAGECWGNNTEAYCRAFGVTDRDAAGAAAARLMRDPLIKARIRHLREEACEQLGVDRRYLLEKRKYIAEHGRNMADRLHALDAMEKSLGLDTPIKIEVDQNSNVNVMGVTGVLKIENPAEFARMMEAVRAARERADIGCVEQASVPV